MKPWEIHPNKIVMHHDERTIEQTFPSEFYGLNKRIVDCVNSVGTAKEIDYATYEEVNEARARHCDGSDNELEIDVPARVSRGDEGLWVQGWMWVPNPEEE